MKCHKYQMTVVENFMSAIHGDEGGRQNRLYIPNKGILCYGFYEKDKVDCFLNDRKSMQNAKKIIKGEGLGENDLGPQPNPEYLGEIEVPDNQINELITCFNTKKQVEEDFQKKGKTLISLLK